MLQSIALIPDNLVTPMITSIAIITGTILGGIFSWIITKNSTYKAIETQSKIESDKKEYEKQNKNLKLCEYAAIIRLDICTSLFQSLRMLKEFDNENNINIYPIPMNANYAEAIVALQKILNLKEMSYIYQLYGIIEKLNNDTKVYNYDDNHFSSIKNDYEMFIKKLFGNNFLEALAYDIDNVTYENLYYNDIIKPGYKNVLSKLDSIVNC
ncbi:MAG: hypothetical protein MUO60_04425 [Clostridiaceae bacterium]|nr:hypothetical protein [Clostridiaceae bacterium]